MNRFLRPVTFLAGLVAVGWVGAGYVGSNPLALAVTALIGAFYIAGALELRRFDQATAGLAQALAELPDALDDLGVWLGRLHPSLRNAVRRRVEGEPVGLPGPAMASTLTGLLVLLGMLGTFTGMVLTLRGTGSALEGATDLLAVRSSLIAPVKGLGLAFGTSIAGVAASAMLGLLSALCRRERVHASQSLDARIATSLRAFSVAHQREESLRLLRRQDELMPTLVDSLRAMTEALQRQAEASNARLLASQERFHENAGAAYAGLAQSVDRVLKESLVDSARVAGATIQPVVEATLAGIARETAALHATLAGTAQRQLEQLSGRFESSTAEAAGAWQAALARHERGSEALSEQLRASHERFAETFEQRAARLVDDVTQRHGEWQQGVATTMADLARETAAVHERTAGRLTTQLDGVAERLDGSAQRVTQGWDAALDRHALAHERTADTTRHALEAAAAAFERHSASLLRSLQQTQAEQGAEAAAREQRRVEDVVRSIEAMAMSLRAEWQQAGAQSLAQQRDVCETMERTAREITAQADAHARGTTAEIAQLLQAAAQAPRAAAEVIAELREKLSDSMARDNALLDERARILETLDTLLGAVNQAATAQRGAIDALVASSATALERVGARFTEQVDAQTGKLAEAAAQVTGGAVEVASLGEAFGFAVQLFTESNDKLGAHLQRVDGALNASMARSDDQLAYYVAQAREVIDLSILSQKQIIEDLQRVAGNAAPARAAA